MERDARNEVAGRDTRAESGVLDQQCIAVYAESRAQREIPEADLILHEGTRLEAASPVPEIQAHLRQRGGFGEREPLAHPVDA